MRFNASISFVTFNIQNRDICIIISEDVSQQIVPLIHDFDRLQSIFILRENHKEREEWIKDWSKVIGVYLDISSICNVIRQATKRCEQNAVPFMLLDTGGDLSKKKLDQLDPMFMYSQILADILLDIQFKQENYDEFIDYCRQTSINNDAELKNIDKFQQNYDTKTAIKWYTSERFLYTTLNRGLRIVDADTIIKMGCFIVELYRQIEQLHTEQYPKGKANESVTVYRGQVVPKIELEKIKRTKGGLIAFNGFLSTSRKREVSSMFAGDDQIDTDLVGILFIITIDTSESAAAFASIKDISLFPEEDEILFVIHSIFRIVNIEPMADISSRVFEVELILSSETDKDLTTLRSCIQEAIPSWYTGWEKFASVLLDMGLFDKAQQICERRLVEVTDEDNRVLIYNQLGRIFIQQGEYEASLGYYIKELAIRQQSLPPNHPNLATSYNNIGSVYFRIGGYSKARSFFERAVNIAQFSLPPNHPTTQLLRQKLEVLNSFFT